MTKVVVLVGVFVAIIGVAVAVLAVAVMIIAPAATTAAPVTLAAVTAMAQFTEIERAANVIVLVCSQDGDRLVASTQQSERELFPMTE